MTNKKKKVGPDPNFNTVLKLAAKIGKKGKGKLRVNRTITPQETAQIMLTINPVLINSQDLRKVKRKELKRRLDIIAYVLGSAYQITQYDKNTMRLLKTTALVLWYGCLATAKTIAYKTRSGKNSSKGRTRIFERLDRLARKNKTLALGIKSAPYFKQMLKQKYYFDGIPQPIIDKYFNVRLEHKSHI